MRLLHPLTRADAQPDKIDLLEPERSAWVCAAYNYRENMMLPSVKKLAPVALILVGTVGLGGCATKGYVRDQIAPVSQRVDALDARLQATDGTAKSALAEAQAASGQAQNNGQRIDQLNGRVDSIEQRMQENQRKRPRN